MILVCMPPSNKMTISAKIPATCVNEALLKYTKRLSTIPAAMNSTSAGMPKRVENLVESTPTSSSTASNKIILSAR
ncbi:hypothetical protein D3C74_396490 [compost metagenome]